jgi:ABC-type polysaccharide transport system permease subunit
MLFSAYCVQSVCAETARVTLSRILPITVGVAINKREKEKPGRRLATQFLCPPFIFFLCVLFHQLIQLSTPAVIMMTGYVGPHFLGVVVVW